MGNEQPLILKYRPSTLDEFKGNDDIVNSLKEVLSRKQGSPKTFLFVGPSGCGKTTLARIVANECGCKGFDFHEKNTADIRGIDSIREIASHCLLSPLEGKVKVYLLDECHKITGDGQHALLKIIEEPPIHVRFILCTTDPQNLLETIKNRCSTYQVGLWETREVYSHLKEIVGLENGTCSSKVIKRIAEEAGGSPRKALTMLDQVLFIDDDQKALPLIKNYSDTDTQVIEICRLVIAKQSSDKWNKMRDLVKTYNGEPESARKAILGYLRTTLLNQSSQNDFANRVAYLYGLFLDKNWMYDGKDLMINSLYESCNY